MTARRDRGIRRTVDKVVLQGIWNRTAGTRQVDMTAETRQPEQDRRDRTASFSKKICKNVNENEYFVNILVRF
jgi:hypothetical protein